MMRHIEIRDLWLHKEVKEGNVIVHKIPGIENPADLMTKILTVGEIVDRLRGLNIHMYREGEVSCVYTYTYPVGEPLEICSVSVQPEDQDLATRDPLSHCTWEPMPTWTGNFGSSKRDRSQNKMRNIQFMDAVRGVVVAKLHYKLHPKPYI